MGFQAAGVEAPPTRQRPRPPFPLLPPSREKHPTPQGLFTSSHQQVLWTNSRSGHNLSASPCWTSASLRSIHPGGLGLLAAQPQPLQHSSCEHQPLPSPATGPFTLTTVLCPPDALCVGAPT